MFAHVLGSYNRKIFFNLSHTFIAIDGIGVETRLENIPSIAKERDFGVNGSVTVWLFERKPFT